MGVIVADGKMNKLSDIEINYLEQLASQAAITIDKANSYAEILKHASMDALTGLNNRRQFDIRLRQEVSASKRKDTPLCCMMIDIDFFKQINDTYGHPVGDHILKEFAQLLKAEIREYDFASRYGGEEFCILLPDTDLDEAAAVAQRLREVVEKEYNISESEAPKMVSITISIGLSKFEPDTQNPYELYKIADQALYKAKTTGRNKVVVKE